MLDPQEFLSDYGIRSISKYHAAHPYVLDTKYGNYSVNYEPGESTTGAFRGKFQLARADLIPINFLLVEALRNTINLWRGFPGGVSYWLRHETDALGR